MPFVHVQLISTLLHRNQIGFDDPSQTFLSFFTSYQTIFFNQSVTFLL